MTNHRPTEYLIGIVHELRKLPVETEWVEFKHNRVEPEEIGEYLSALANSAALLGKVNAYLVWGVDNETHDLIGTTFRPAATKFGNEELENWLLRLLDPKINFRFYVLEIEEKPVVLLEIGAAFRHPVRFKHQEFIRVGSYKKKLKDYPERERALWRVFDQVPFERRVAAEHISGENVLKFLDYPAYFDLLELPLPDGRAAILEALARDELIHSCMPGTGTSPISVRSFLRSSWMIFPDSGVRPCEWSITKDGVGLRPCGNRSEARGTPAVSRA